MWHENNASIVPVWLIWVNQMLLMRVVCKKSSESCSVTHSFPPTVKERRSKAFYQNVWVSRPPESTDNEQSWFPTGLNSHVLSTPVMILQRGASYILNQVFQIIVNVLVFEAFLRWKWPGNDSKVWGSVFNRYEWTQWRKPMSCFGQKN